MQRNFSRNRVIFLRSLTVVALSISQFGYPGAPGRAQSAQGSTGSSAGSSPSATNKVEAPWQYFPAVLRPAIKKTSEPELETVVLSDIELKGIGAVSPFKNFSVVVCTVENRTAIPIIVDGDHAVLGDGAAASVQNKCASQGDIDAIGRPPTTMKQKFVSNLKATIVGAATIGGEQMYEGFKSERKPVPQRYAWDEERKEHEEGRLGERVLYPGDSTQGNVYFPLQAAQPAGMILSMPVKSFYNAANKAMLSGKIEGAGGAIPGGSTSGDRKL